MISNDLLKTEYNTNKQSIHHISKKYNVSYGVLKRKLQNLGCNKRDGRGHIFLSDDIQQIIHLYDIDKMPISVINVKFDTSVKQIKEILKANNIHIRNNSESKKCRTYKSPIKDSLPLDSIIKQYTQENKSLQELGKLYKCSYVTIGNLLRKNGIKVLNSTESANVILNKNFWSKIPIDEIISKYLNEGCSIDELSSTYNISRKALYTLLKKHNIKRRGPLEAFETRKRWFKPYTLPSGKVIKVQGYEPQFLDHVFKNNIWKEEDFDFSPPPIKYKTPDGKQHNYFPDFYIPKDNLIIECKSAYILNKQTLEIQTLKEQAVFSNGFTYLFILDNNFAKI